MLSENTLQIGPAWRNGHGPAISDRTADANEAVGKGSGGDFDQIAMSKLFVLGLVEVSEERRLRLTKAGRDLRDKIDAKPKSGH